MKYAFLFLLIILLAACGNTSSQNNKPAVKTAIEEENELPKRTDYPHIPVAEKNITMTDKDGWEEGTFDFHLGYCQQMMASIEDSVDIAVFCECFVSKIQYYYPPAFFKEAYEDQVKWNQLCYKKGYEAKKAFYQKQK